MFARRSILLASFGFASSVSIFLNSSISSTFITQAKALSLNKETCIETSGEWSEGNVNLTTIGPEGGHTRVVYAVAFSPDGRFLASGGVNKEIKIWNLETRSEIKSYSTSHEIINLAFSPNGRFLVSGTLDGNVALWDTSDTSSSPLRIISNHSVAGTSVSRTSVAFSPDGQILATSGDDQEIRLWDLQTNSLVYEIDENQAVYTLAFSSNGNILASAGSRSTINLWNWNNEDKIKSFGPYIGSVDSVAFHPKNSEIITFSVQALNTREQRTEPSNYNIYFLNFEEEQIETVLNEHENDVLALSFNSDGSLLASASRDKTIKLWDTEQECLIRSFENHSGAVRSIVFKSNSNVFATAGADSTIRIWSSLR